MNKAWDSVDSAEEIEESHRLWAREAFRVLKPGGYILAFGGTRTYHRLACAIEDAGFEIRDQIDWGYGTGFPKSMNLPSGLGTALKPAHEPICCARKSLIGTVAANVELIGTGALNIDACRIGVGDDAYAKNCSGDRGHADNRSRDMDFAMGCGTAHAAGRWPANVILSHDDRCTAVGTATAPGKAAGSGKGSTKSIYSQVANSKGNGGNAGTPPGEVVLYACVPGCPVRMLDEQTRHLGGGGAIGGGTRAAKGRRAGGKVAFGADDRERGAWDAYGDAGGASRFFYCSKPSGKERNLGLEDFYWKRAKTSSGYVRIDEAEYDELGKTDAGRKQRAVGNIHPTVKPIDLMAYLIRLVTPPDGVVLDPFLGSGTTAIAAAREGFAFVGIEREADYVDVALARLAAAVPAATDDADAKEVA